MQLGTLQDRYKSWTGSAADLVTVVDEVCRSGLVPVEWSNVVPTVRQIRDWRVKGVFTHRKGQAFGARQVFECLVAIALKSSGWRLTQVAVFTRDASIEALHDALREAAEVRAPFPRVEPATERMAMKRSVEPPRASASSETIDEGDAMVAAKLLAQGAWKLYERVETGAVVRQNAHTIPAELHAALCHLGRLYVLEGKPDEAACAHDVLDRCRRPLMEWGLDAFEHAEFELREVVIVDPELYVPTQDCLELARASGTGEQQVLEERFHQRLLTAAERLGAARKQEVYSHLRGFVARHPFVHHRDILDFTRKYRLEPTRRELRSFYTDAPRAFTVDGMVRRCKRCGTMLRPAPKWQPEALLPCPLRQCREKGPAGERPPIPYEEGESLLAQEPILAYWVGPGIDELILFRAGTDAGRDVQLYPQGDACDVGVDGLELGIDAKSYTCPYALGSRLRKRGIGGLKLFRRRILAIGDELLASVPRYLERVREAMGVRLFDERLELMSVSDAVAIIKGS